MELELPCTRLNLNTWSLALLWRRPRSSKMAQSVTFWGTFCLVCALLSISLRWAEVYWCIVTLDSRLAHPSLLLILPRRKEWIFPALCSSSISRAQLSAAGPAKAAWGSCSSSSRQSEAIFLLRTAARSSTTQATMVILLNTLILSC